MTRPLSVFVLAGAVAVAQALAAPSRAEGIAIDHDPVGCVVAGRFPSFEARFSPADQVSRARIDFHAEGDTRWYFVEMKPEAGAYHGILPQPLKQTGKIHYYIEVTDKSLAESRTEEYAPVVAGAGECSKMGLLTATPMAKATVAVGSAGQHVVGVSAAGTAGTSTVPAGFASAGIAGAAGGLSVGVVAATVVAAGAAAGAAVAAGGQDSLTGHWTGSLTVNYPTLNCTQTAGLAVDLLQSGNTFKDATLATTPRTSTCGDTPGPRFTSPLTGGTINGTTVRFTNNGDPGPDVRFESTWTGTISGKRMSGTLDGRLILTNGFVLTGTGGTWELVRQ